MSGCPSPDGWFALGSDPQLEQHLDQCGECRAVAAMIGRAGVLADAPTQSGERVGLVPELVSPGTTLGRFIVRGAIGAGGMGVVLEAFDPKLERSVALKVVRRMRDDAGWERAKDRVLAEAKAMARLSHPNVVAIHDLLEIDDERLIAMEYVRGPDLEAWLAERRTHQQALAVIVGIAEGLAAAHEAGVVHRDIKPSNILIANGVARVTDFGLAGLAGVEASGKGGTPGYVAPELVAGGDADARSDQYAFAVTAWRTLFGSWPAESRTARGPLAPVLARAMSPDPNQRFASMREVVAALHRAARAPARRRIIVAAVAGVVVVGSGLLAYRSMHANPMCELDAAIDPAWSASRRASWQAAMQPVLGATTPGLVVNIDRAWTAWQAMARSACERPAPGTLACARSLRRKLVAVIEHAPTTGSGREIEDTLAVLRATNCLTAPPPQPVALAPADRVMHELIVAQLDDATALSWLGQYHAANAKLEDLASRVPVGDDPLRGELLYRRADALLRIGDTAGALPVLQEALTLAERASNPIARVNTMVMLLDTYQELGRVNEARALATVAEAAALAVPFDPTRAGRLARVLASIAYISGDFAEAERKYREVVAIQGKWFADKGDKDPDLAGALHNLGMAVHAQGRGNEAAELQRRALATFESTFGADHPNTALPLNQLASIAFDAKRYDEAAAYYRRTIAIFEKSLGANHPNLSEPILGLCRTVAALGNVAEGLAHCRRARKLAYALGEYHPFVALIEYRIAFLLDNPEKAAPLIEHSVAAWNNNGMDVPDAHLARFLLAESRWAAGRRTEARELAVRARAALEALDTRYADTVKDIDQWLATHR